MPVQRVVIVAILINAAILGVQTAPNLPPSTSAALEWVNTAFLALFVLELVIKLYAFRLKFFASSWNVFDFVVIAIGIIPGSGFAVLRALRVLRVLRLISMVPALRRIVEALVKAIPGILSIGVLLFILFYVGAVMGSSLFGSTFPQYFGSLGQSLISLFQIMTMDNWSILSREVATVYPWAWGFFIPFILVSAFTVLNLFIAVMVDAMKFLDDGTEDSKAPAGALRRSQTDLSESLANGLADPLQTSANPGSEATQLGADDGAQDALNPAEYRELLREVRALRAEISRMGDR